MRKTRRVVALICCVVCILGISSMFVFAYGTMTLNNASNTLHMDGYIDFLEGPNVIKDKIWYHASIYGTYDMTGIYRNADHGDKNCCYIIPGTNTKMLSKVFLYKSKTFVTSGDSGVYVGYGGTYGILQMNLMGNKGNKTAT